MSGLRQDDAFGARNRRLYRTHVTVHVGNVRLAGDEKRRNLDLREPAEYRFGPPRELSANAVGRIRLHQRAHLVLRGAARRRRDPRVLRRPVLDPLVDRTSRWRRSPAAPVREVVGERQSAHDRAHEHERAHHASGDPT